MLHFKLRSCNSIYADPDRILRSTYSMYMEYICVCVCVCMYGRIDHRWMPNSEILALFTSFLIAVHK